MIPSMTMKPRPMYRNMDDVVIRNKDKRFNAKIAGSVNKTIPPPIAPTRPIISPKSFNAKAKIIRTVKRTRLMICRLKVAANESS